MIVAASLVVFVETAYQLALGEPTRLPGVAQLRGGALQLLLVLSGAVAAWPLARALRGRQVSI
jgi:hypothetical protein